MQKTPNSTEALQRELSQTDSLHLRAWAIFLILTHNFLHWIFPEPGENEFSFDAWKAEDFLRLLAEQPAHLPTWLATYLGHYGVHLFVFLSAYGLARKYQNRPLPPWLSFQKSRWRALFPAILCAALAWFLYEGSRLGFATVLREDGLNLLLQASGLANFFPESVYHPIGPWWFIGLILQLYLLFPWLEKAARRWGAPFLLTLIALSLLCEKTFIRELYAHSKLQFNHHAPGHLDTFALGLLLARSGLPALRWSLPAAALFLFASLSARFWPASALLFIFATLTPLRILNTRLAGSALFGQLLTQIGRLALPLFLVNGFLREPLITYVRENPHPLTSLGLCALFLLLSLLVAGIISRCEKKIQGIIKI